MSTRAMIYLKLNPQDVGKFKKCNIDKLGLRTDVEDLDKEVIRSRVRKVKTKKYISIFHKFDGYTDGLGKVLFYKFNDYDKLLNMLLCGDEISVVSNALAEPYINFDERWDFRKPISQDHLPLEPVYAYDYLFQDGKWYFRHNNMQRWRPLTRRIIKKFK